MNVLICGANGFIGRHLHVAFTAAGHQVRRGVRKPRIDGDIAIDYARDHDPAVWLPRLDGIDVVINTIGILIETPEQPFSAIHSAAPQALFSACASKGGIRVVQISALGVEQGNTGYFSSKLAADRHLTTLDLDWAVVRASLVYGEDGASSRFFRMLATLPIAGLPGHGDQALQPVHINDVCACVLTLAEAKAPLRHIYEIAGPEIVSYRGLLERYRAALGLGRGCFVSIPMSLMRITARLAETLPQRVLSRDTLKMLAGGNTTQRNDTAHLLGREPINIAQFIPPTQQAPLRYEAVNTWGMPLLQIALAAMWIAAAICSLIESDVSLTLLARAGVTGGMAEVALYGAAGIDLLIGLCTLWRPGSRIWLVQIGLVFLYTLVITLKLPEFWLHPFGPLVKNLPILAILLLLHATTPANHQK